MKLSTYKAIIDAGFDYYKNLDTEKFPEGMAYCPLTGAYSDVDHLGAEGCTEFVGCFDISRKDKVMLNPDGLMVSGTQVCIRFAETPLGDLSFTVKFSNQIKFSGIKAANAPDLADWVKKVINAAKTYAESICQFMNLSI
jgi:hypothetical protein